MTTSRSEPVLGRLAGKVAIVTGGARGMGASHVRMMRKEGAVVIATDIALPDHTEEEDGENLTLQHDVSSAAQWEDIISQVLDRYGKIDVLVNNAGIVSSGPTSDLTEAEYRRVFEINQLSVFLGMHAVLEPMRAGGGGSIINISSAMGLVGNTHSLAYVSSKFAVTGMTKAAAAEFGQFNIRVNAVHPGVVRTPMVTALGEFVSEIERTVSSLPIARMGRPEEVSALVVLLASNEATFSTGSSFVADGGWTCV